MEHKKIIFVLPVTTQPRFIKRIKYYIHNDYNITVASFERDYLSKNKLPNDINFISLGKIEAKKYHKRIFILIAAFFKLRKITNESSELYVLSQDMLLFSHFLKKRKWIYEIGDIRQINIPLINKLYSTTQKWILKKVDQIIVTSPKFQEYLINKYNVSNKKILVFENKLTISMFPLSKKLKFNRIIDNKFDLGIIGLFRYQNIIWFLNEYQNIQPNFNIQIWGLGPLKNQIMDYVDNKKIKFSGEFKYPEDLWEIYNDISLSFVMYDNNDVNVRLALPNKLYESIYYKRPIIVSDNTYLGEKVKGMGIGLVWAQNRMEDLINYLNNEKFVSEYNKYGKALDNIKTTKIYENNFE